MDKDEALRLALEALENWLEFDPENFGEVDKKAITAIKAALEAKDEPVAFVETKEVQGQMCSFIYRADLTKLLPDGAKLYTTPPQRTWVGLTDEEISDCMKMSIQKTCRAIEAKLKEKNT
jgi:hypothetical protein